MKERDYMHFIWFVEQGVWTSVHQSGVSRALCHKEADGLGRGVAEGDQLVGERSSAHDC